MKAATKIEILQPGRGKRLPAGVFSETLVCKVHSIFCTRRAIHLCFPSGDCCDMSGAIRLASMLRRKVKIIVTYQGRDVDRIYWRVGKKWNATRVRP